MQFSFLRSCGLITALVLSQPSFAQSDLAQDMARLPGRATGWVPGGILTPDMRPISSSELGSVPVYDVEHICGVMRRLQGPSADPAVKECIRSEQRSYDYLKLVWDQVSLGSREVCVAIARKKDQAPDADRNPWRYAGLKACIDVRADYEEQLRDVKFRR